jgi:hypothetical protein
MTNLVIRREAAVNGGIGLAVSAAESVTDLCNAPSGASL